MPDGEHSDVLEKIGALTRSFRTLAADAYSAFDVGSVQAKFVRYIGRHTRISQADLSRATWTDPALTGRTIEGLVERGWIRRTRSEEDRRQYVLELTPAGQRVRKRVDQARERIATRIAAALDARDVADFDRVTAKILSALQDADGPPQETPARPQSPSVRQLR